MTESPPTTTDLVVIPVTGEAIDLNGPTTDLARTIEQIRGYLDGLIDVRRHVADELAARLDTANSRTEQVGDYLIKTNAPTQEDYSPAVLRAELEELITAGTLDAVVLDRVITTPEPKPPEPRVDKREINKLKRSTDPAVLRAVATARTITPNTRTITVTRTEGAA